MPRAMYRPGAGLKRRPDPHTQDLAFGLRPGLTCFALTGSGGGSYWDTSRQNSVVMFRTSNRPAASAGGVHIS